MTGTIKTGADAGFKASVINAKKEQETQALADVQDAEIKAKDLSSDQVCYTKIGDPVFNTHTGFQAIKFHGGSYICDKGDDDAISWLDPFISKGILEKAEGKAADMPEAQ